MPFHILIVGTGIAGLAAAIALADKGHHITILEATSELKAIGGIIALQPNGNRALDKLGVYESLLKICGTEPMTMGWRRFEDGEWLIRREGKSVKEEFGYPLWTVHRADFQQVLYEAAKKRDIMFRLGCKVVDVVEGGERPVVVIKGGERIAADLIIGADGTKSVVRKSVGLDSEGTIRDSRLDVTRANIPEAIMRSDPETAECMKHIALWFGPSTTVANVPIRRGDELLLGYDFIHPRDSNSADGGSMLQDVEHMKTYFNGFAPVIQKALSYVDEAYVWRMMETMPASWVSTSGKVVLVGDAAHAVLPFAGQGGCMAIEDALALAECLERAHSTTDFPALLKAFQRIREPRCKLVQEFGATQAKRATLPDGPEQDQRDRRFKMHNAFAEQREWDGVSIDEVPEGIDSGWWDAWLLGYDAVAFTSRALDKEFGRAKQRR